MTKYFENSKGDLLVDPIEENHDDIEERTEAEFKAKLAIKNNPQKTYAQELAELNAEYIAKVDALAEKITKAKAWDGASETSKVTALRAKKTDLDTKYISDLTLINEKWSN